MTKRVLNIIIFILLSSQGFSQGWSYYKYEFYYGIGATNFMGDVGAPNLEYASPINNYVWVNFWNTIGFTTNAGLRYHHKDRQYFRANIFLGQLYADDPTEDIKYWDMGRSFNTFFTEIAVKYEFMICEEKRKTSVYRKLGETFLKNINIPTYLFIGAGATFNVGKYSKIVNEGKNVDKETFANIAPVIPFGFGFKYKINKLTYINLEAEWHFTISDGVDNVVGDGFGEWVDQYQTITFNIIHKLRKNQNGYPKFKRR